MAEKYELTKVYYPTSLSDLLTLAHSKPKAVIFSGGTYLLRNQSSRSFRLPETVITLHTVDELRKIGRTDARIDVGASASIEQILKTGRKMLPRILVDTLEGIAPPGIRGLATLGGNICVRERSMTSHATLHILDAQLEFRSPSGGRWIPATRIRTPEGILAIEPGEVLTRIRLPLEPWNVQYFRRTGSSPYTEAPDSLAFSAVARTGRGILGDVRFAVASHLPVIYRNRDLETTIIGRKLPLNRKDISAFVELLESNIGDNGYALSPSQTDKVIFLVKSLLEGLPAE